MNRVARTALIAFISLLIVAAAMWGALALAYSDLRSETLRGAAAAAFAMVSLVALIALWIARWRWRAFAAYLLLFVLLVAWWERIEPSNDRDWQADVARSPHATIDGDSVTVHNIRDFSYRTETDYLPAWRDRRYDLRQLEGVDLVAVYWMGPAIAHVFLSFAFATGDQLAISIEARKEKSEGYSTVKGFFRQYELYYVVAEERDVIGLRTNHRHDPPEDVYLYRLQIPVDNARRLFLDYMREINSLQARPAFYNTLTSNCTTNIWVHSLVNPGHLPFSWKILASGHVPEYLYETGRLDTRVPFAELRSRARVNVRAQAADGSPDFSRLIRQP